MKKFAGWAEAKFSKHLPLAYYHLVQRPRIAYKFRTEEKLAQGAQLSANQNASILFFTTQKCASRYVSTLISRLSTAAGMVHADYDAYVAMKKVAAEHNPFKGALPTAFSPNGYYYGPIGTYRDIPALEKYRVVLQLRDPRDLLTSLYFSTAFSHAVISPKLIRQRRTALQQDIDAYVIEAAHEYVKIFDEYLNRLLGRKEVLFVKYEEMVSNFPDWLSKVSTHLGLEGNTQIIADIQTQASFNVGKEDQYTHKRQVSPGDHLRKLKPATIAELNKQFKPILKTLNY